MEFTIKLKSQFNAMISFNEIKKKKIDENSFITLNLKILDGEILTIFVEPIGQDSEIILPYNIYIQCLNGKLKINSHSITELNYAKIYILTLKKFKVVSNMSVIKTGSSYSVFNTLSTCVTIFDKTIPLKKTFSSATELSSPFHTVLSFDDEYLLVFNNNNEVLFNDFYNKLNISSSSISVLTNLHDIAKHAILCTITKNEVCRKTVYEFSHPKLTPSPHLVPLAFLQALKVDNFNLCKHYLSQHLKDIATKESLKSFFGDFKSFDLDKKNIVLFYADNSHKVFSFELSFNKITKINTL